MPRNHTGANIDRSEFYGAMQRIIDTLFEEEEAFIAEQSFEMQTTAAEQFGVSEHTASVLGLSALIPAQGSAAQQEAESVFTVRRLDVVMAAESADLPDDLLRIVNLLPPGNYSRQKLCDQINSAITGHAWGQVYGTVS